MKSAASSIDTGGQQVRFNEKRHSQPPKLKMPNILIEQSTTSLMQPSLMSKRPSGVECGPQGDHHSFKQLSIEKHDMESPKKRVKLNSNLNTTQSSIAYSEERIGELPDEER